MICIIREVKSYSENLNQRDFSSYVNYFIVKNKDGITCQDRTFTLYTRHLEDAHKSFGDNNEVVDMREL